MNRAIKSGMMNWKTTAAGVATFLGIFFSNLSAELDSNPETVADWNVVVGAASLMVVALLARDSDKSTEESR